MPRIRKYENRRLYDTEASAYVNLDDIAAMVRRGQEVSVEDAKSGTDITQEVLLQVLSAHPAGALLVPVGLLRRLIRAAGNPALAGGVDPRLAQGLDLFHRQLEAWEAAMPAAPHWGAPPAHEHTPAPGPTARRAGAEARPPREAEPPREPPRGPGAHGEPEAAPDPELDALRRRLDELEQRLRRR